MPLDKFERKGRPLIWHVKKEFVPEGADFLGATGKMENNCMAQGTMNGRTVTERAASLKGHFHPILSFKRDFHSTYCHLRVIFTLHIVIYG